MNAKQLAQLLDGLSFISRTAGGIEGANEDDWMACDAMQAEVGRLRVMLAEVGAGVEGEIVASSEAEDRVTFGRAA